MIRVKPEEFQKLNLEVHSILKDVPLHDVSAIDLPGGGAGRTISDVRHYFEMESLRTVNPAVNFLVSLRGWLGQMFAWDTKDQNIYDHMDLSYIHRLNDDVKVRSILPPGSDNGLFQLLYLLDHEWLMEMRNATAHALSVIALIETPGGYRLYWAIYVKPVSKLTMPYMALIDPFRHLIVYPAILNRVQKDWKARYA